MSVPAKITSPGLQSKLFWSSLLPLIVLATSYGMQRSVALLGLDLHHDSLMFDAARRLLNGEHPFKDFFYQYNLGTVFFHALALKALGSQIASLKIATAMVYAVIAFLIYSCGATQGSRWWAFGAAALWSTLSPFYMPALSGYHAWSTVYMMASVMGGALFLTLALRSRPWIWSVLAGVCFDLAFWFKQVAGLQILAVLVWLIYNAVRLEAGSAAANKFRQMSFGYTVGGLVSALPFFFYLQEDSLFYDWLRSAFVFNGFFAASGDSASGVMAFARLILPVARDMGYVSVVWALLPLGLLAIVFMPVPGNQNNLLKRSDSLSLNASLFAVLGFAGWAEYFPLAHAFHTQLFMAPVFVLFVIAKSEISYKDVLPDRQRLFLTLLIALAVAAVVYESLRHLHGLRTKVSMPTQEIWGDAPAGGLKLEPDQAHSFVSFYDALVAAKLKQGSLPSIPMSVDPLRALLPDDVQEPATFKMGLDWTWPNEIVEPGFNRRIAQGIAERRSLVYADSLIAIPGYLPVAVLEMPSPMTLTHTLYIPSADRVVTEPPTVVVNDVVYASSKAFPETDRTAIALGDQPLIMDFFRLNELEGLSLSVIGEVHVSIIRPEDIPHTLSSLQLDNFLMAVPDEKYKTVANLYTRRSNGKYKLRWPLERGQTLALAKFLLSRGKLFEQQDRPVYYSTLSSSPDHRPFLAMTTADDEIHRIAWAKAAVRGRSAPPEGQNVPPAIFLAIPAGAIHHDEESIFYVQIVMKNHTTRNFYLDYLPGDN